MHERRARGKKAAMFEQYPLTRPVKITLWVNGQPRSKERMACRGFHGLVCAPLPKGQRCQACEYVLSEYASTKKYERMTAEEVAE